MIDLSYSISEFDPINASDELFEKYLDFGDILFREQEPDDPFMPRQLRRGLMQNPSPHNKTFYWISFKNDGENEDIIIASASVNFSLPSSPSYKTNKHVAGCGISVHPDYRRQGIGTKLLKILLNKIDNFDEGITVIQTGATLESGHQFCKKLDGIEALSGAENRLRMSDVDWEMIKKWKEEGKNRAKDVEIESFEDAPDSSIEDYVDVYTETMNQQPLGELETRINVTPETRRDQEKRYGDQGVKWFTKIARESDGKISGLTEMFYHEGMKLLL